MFKSIRVSPSSSRSSLSVICVCAGAKSLPRGLGLSPSARKAVDEAMKSPGFKADAGETAAAGSGRIVMGLGASEDLTEQMLRRIGGRLVRKLDRIAPKHVTLYAGAASQGTGIKTTRAGICLGEGIGLANWRVHAFDGEATKASEALPALTLATPDAALRGGLKEGLTVAECVNEARVLGATPPNICHPGWLATRMRSFARSAGLKCSVISYARAKELGMGGIVNVGKGSAQKPCLIQLEHRPSRVAAAAKGEHLVLVGKTITYDTGGYSLKIQGSMRGMKYDKCGGMAVIGTMAALARLKVPVRVTALLPAAENMVSGDAYRPDDIIEMFNGVTVEVTNTDAEGRLVLGDALAYACKRLKPTALVDVATLTGGVVVALGSWCAGLWCNDDQLQERVEQAADTSGERVWPMPLWPQHRDFMRSRHADIWNSNAKRDGHPIQGAAFLSYFVDEEVPWAHLDIAGMASVDGRTDLYSPGPTGYGVRLLTDLAAGFAE